MTKLNNLIFKSNKDKFCNTKINYTLLNKFYTSGCLFSDNNDADFINRINTLTNNPLPEVSSEDQSNTPVPPGLPLTNAEESSMRDTAPLNNPAQSEDNNVPAPTTEEISEEFKEVNDYFNHHKSISTDIEEAFPDYAKKKTEDVLSGEVESTGSFTVVKTCLNC
jgi:hypothetical protein